MTIAPLSRRPSRAAARQRGVVLLFALIALLILLLGAVALIRSFHSSSFTAGNIGFKRDMLNQSELAVSTALARFQGTGDLVSATSRSTSNLTAGNYSAIQLQADAHGIPNALFALTTSDPNMITGTGGVKIFYVIDRLCSAGSEGKLDNAVGPTGCVLGDALLPSGVSSSLQQNATTRLSANPGGGQSVSPQSVVYRLSVRVDGPRGTQSYFQSTFSIPS